MENCVCKDGVSIDVRIEYSDDEYDYKVVVIGYPGYEFRSNVSKEMKSASLDRGSIYWHGTQDGRKDPKNPGEIQQVIIHEVGHMLGLEHPGQTLPLSELPNRKRPKQGSALDYEADYQSLMGRGMELRDYDFQRAFCNKIKWNECKDSNPWYKFW